MCFMCLSPPGWLSPLQVFQQTFKIHLMTSTEERNLSPIILDPLLLPMKHSFWWLNPTHFSCGMVGFGVSSVIHFVPGKSWIQFLMILFFRIIIYHHLTHSLHQFHATWESDKWVFTNIKFLVESRTKTALHHTICFHAGIDTIGMLIWILAAFCN